MAKGWTARLALAATMGIAIVTLSGAPAAAETCPAPGTGLPGARNMAAAGTHMTDAMADHTAPEGDAGMHTAVVNTAC
jgi:hypothetical protein